jgi:hypothetical protein
MLNTISISQVVLGVLWPALITIEKLAIPMGPLQDTVVAATNSIFAVLVIIFRKPSTQGGTVARAVTIAPTVPVGANLVAAPPK